MTKLTKELLDKVRHIEGFPIGEDEDIIALSDPPHYTACPNPFIKDFIKEHGKPYDEETDDYHREPFAADVSEGKNDPIYKAHNYHTKVPHKAIMRYILHYTEPGDIVFDGFCGTGMTGVAAQMCDNPDLEFKMNVQKEMGNADWGVRKAVLYDLSPVASFISYCLNSPLDSAEYLTEMTKIIEQVNRETSWMFQTKHYDDKKEYIGYGKVEYTVWSDVFICPNCGDEIIFYSAAKDSGGRVSRKINCANCKAEWGKNALSRAQEIFFDRVLKRNCTRSKQVPVLISYKFRNKRFLKRIDEYDLNIIGKVENIELPYWVPLKKLPEGVNTRQPRTSHGLDYLHQFYSVRALYSLSLAYHLCEKAPFNVQKPLLFTIEQAVLGMSKLARYVPTHFSQVNQYLSGTLYVASQIVDVSFDYIAALKTKRLSSNLSRYNNSFAKHNYCIGTQSSSDTGLPDNCIDYIFTDPPFGSNLMYSELNFFWEAWLKVSTNNESEAIVNRVQRKELPEYQVLMEQCFAECYRILKPDRWMTVEFHNSANAVWNSIQEALLQVGFVVADVRTLDKKQGSFKQVTSTTAVKQDLIISAYKPRDSFKLRFLETAGSEEAVWQFVRQHLKKLPVIVERNNKLDIITERQAFLLYDRMVAYHVVNGITVPVDAGDFYNGLIVKFIERDSMYFLADQVNEYDSKRMSLDLNSQLSLFVSDEKSAIQWLYQELLTPQTYQELQPKFMREANFVRHEQKLELAEILDQNFLQDDKGRWYVPDPNKLSDLEKLREKALLREFDEYKDGEGMLKVFRTEAVRAGFKACWQNRDYTTIVKIADRIPEKVLQEDQTMLMFYNNALTRVEK